MLPDRTKKRDNPVQALLSQQDSLRQEIALEEGSLRFNKTCVGASTLAGQYYCEKKVEMQFIHGEIETKTKTDGTQAHEALTVGAVKEKRETVFHRILSGELVILQEAYLLSKHEGTIVAGVPDSVVFSDGAPIFLFEFKFSASPIPYNSYHVQAKVYCMILEGMGFNTDRLYYTLVVVPPSLRGESHLFEKIVTAVIEKGPTEARMKVDEANIYVHKYRRDNAVPDVEWALDYWRGLRNATPTKNPNKCRRCEYREECDEKTET